jgi:hypothetical protein
MTATGLGLGTDCGKPPECSVPRVLPRMRSHASFELSTAFCARDPAPSLARNELSTDKAALIIIIKEE